MKKLIFLVSFLVSIILINDRVFSSDHHFKFGYFYSSLRNYGSWMEMDDGFIVWKPRFVEHHWTPYTIGGWIWTTSGWYWDSYEPFGYIVYHYGRWYNDDYYGWIWIPDNQWSPAWVEWRYDDDFIGWVPLSPYASFSISFGISWSRTYVIHHHHWNFVRYSHFCNSNVNNYFVNSNVKYRIYSNTKTRSDYRYRDNAVFNGGVEPRAIEERGNIKIRRTDLVVRESNDNRDPVIRSNNRIEVNVRNIERENNRNNDLKFERAERKTSLEINNISIGQRNSQRTFEERKNREPSYIDEQNLNNIQEKNIERLKVKDSDNSTREIITSKKYDRQNNYFRRDENNLDVPNNEQTQNRSRENQTESNSFNRNDSRRNSETNRNYERNQNRNIERQTESNSIRRDDSRSNSESNRSIERTETRTRQTDNNSNKENSRNERSNRR